MADTDALAAARNYLRSVGVTERSYPVKLRKEGRVIATTWDQVVREVAEVIRELGLVHRYAGTEHRSTRKRRAYRQAEVSGAQQTRRSERVENRPLDPEPAESETALTTAYSAFPGGAP